MHVGIETRGFTVLMIENMQEFPFFKRQIIPRAYSSTHLDIGQREHPLLQNNFDHYFLIKNIVFFPLSKYMI